MMPKPSIAFAVVLLATLGLGAAPARAELAIDIFGGVSWTKSTDVAVDGIDGFYFLASGTGADRRLDGQRDGQDLQLFLLSGLRAEGQERAALHDRSRHP
jgi:hypothetical protein